MLPKEEVEWRWSRRGGAESKAGKNKFVRGREKEGKKKKEKKPTPFHRQRRVVLTTPHGGEVSRTQTRVRTKYRRSAATAPLLRWGRRGGGPQEEVEVRKKNKGRKIPLDNVTKSCSRLLESAFSFSLRPAAGFFLFLARRRAPSFLHSVAAGGGREERMDPFLAQLALAAAGAAQGDDRLRGGGINSVDGTRRRGGPPPAPFRGNADNAKTRICLR